MARETVYISPIKVRTAMHGPKGLVTKFHIKVGTSISATAKARSPVNNVKNQFHRQLGTAAGPKTPGTYKASWGFRNMRGANGHVSRLRIYNTADHALIVEEGRSGSSRFQAFSWRGAPLVKRAGGRRSQGRYPSDRGWKWYMVTAGPGQMLSRTRSRGGKHILYDSTRMVLARYRIVFAKGIVNQHMPGINRR